MTFRSSHPTKVWKRDAQHSSQQDKLRLATMAGHMQIDKIAARRAALIDLLADGRPHLREEIWATITVQLGDDECWGKRPHEALARDLAVLRLGGLRIAYSRRPEIMGYYLQHPPLPRPLASSYGAVNWQLIATLRQLPVPLKNERAFAAADFALRQKRLLLREAHPDWTATAIEKEARRLVYGDLEDWRS